MLYKEGEGRRKKKEARRRRRIEQKRDLSRAIANDYYLLIGIEVG